MKRFKSLLSLVLVLVMMMSLAVPALAVDGAQDGAEDSQPSTLVAPTLDDLKNKIEVIFNCDVKDHNHEEVIVDEEEMIVSISGFDAAKKEAYVTVTLDCTAIARRVLNDNNVEADPATRTSSFWILYTEDGWTVNAKPQVKLPCVAASEDEKPTPPSLDNYKVKLACAACGKEYDQSFALTGNPQVQGDAGTGWYSELVVDANDYLRQYKPNNKTHTCISDSTETVMFRWDETNQKWNVDTVWSYVIVKFDVKCEEPAPQTYTITFNGNGGVTNGNETTYMQENVSGDVPLDNNQFVRNDYNFLGWSENANATTSTHQNKATINVTRDITLFAVWKENAPPTPDAPGKPNDATLNSLIKVSIDCTDRNRHTSDPYTFAKLIADSYTVSTPTGDLTNGYTATVTINPAKYLAEYNKINAGHVLSTAETAKTVTLKATYANDTWTWALATAGAGTVTFQVEHGYTVTYQWKGDAPYGVEPPVDSKIYSDGDTAYVAAAPRDEAWSCKGGEWKWDRINERWYWDGCSHGNHNHTYWYADKVDGQIGYWVFTGWERQVWVDGNRWQHGYWKTETLRPGQKITVNSDVVIYGTWEFKAAAGTVVLSKTVKGLDTDDSFTFEIYDANNTRKPYKVVELEDGDRTYVSLPNGTYYITEVDAEVKGYDLVVTVDGDIDADGGKFTIKGDAKIIKYTNTYKLGGPELNKKDHIAYLNGYADGTVKPDANITREEVATIFYRLLTAESRERYATNSNSFTDVKATRWSNTAISTLANAGIINGYPDGSFKPAGYITRGEMASIISKFAELTGGRTTFTDISNHWAAAAIRSAAANGWINGYKDGTFKPNQYITRAETVSMINRVLERNPDTVGDLLNGMKTFTDNMKTTKWYYFAIQEAANGHSYSRDPYGNESWTKLN